MLNIKIQCCAMIILLLVSYFYYRLPRMIVRTKKVFDASLVISNLCILTDILSVFAIYYADSLPSVLVVTSCKVYLFFLAALIYCGFLYICADIYLSDAVFRRKMFTYGAVLAATSALLVFLPIYYTSNEDGSRIYSYGPATTVIYLFFLIIFVSILVHMYSRKSAIQKRRRMAVSIWLAIWLMAALLQSIDSTFLIVSFGGSLGVLIIFSMIENPELNLDKESSFFHIAAMTQYLSEAYGKNKKFMMICTGFLAEQADYYKTLECTYIFVGGGEIYLLFDEKYVLENVLRQLSEKYEKQDIYVLYDSAVADSPAELLSILKAAQRLQTDRQRGNVCVIDDALKSRIETWRKTELLIGGAIAEDRVEVFYQPIYSVREQRFCSAEALCRIRAEDGSIVPPGAFIPVAEADGSITVLGKIIFDKVCAFLKQSVRKELGLQYVEVNLSVVQAEDKHLAADILASIEKYRVDTDSINLEITESASIKGKEQLLQTMGILIAHGITFSLDDFGTGQSNLDYMASMPVQIVKFDSSMTREYFTSERTKYIMDAAIRMIHSMDMKIVAEGIESKEQLDCMLAQGIDYIQGFYFSKPLPESEFIQFLRENNSI